MFLRAGLCRIAWPENKKSVHTILVNEGVLNVQAKFTSVCADLPDLPHNTISVNHTV